MGRNKKDHQIFRKNIISFLILGVLLLYLLPTYAYIREPDNIIYGYIYINGTKLTQTDTSYTVNLEVSGEELANYTMGDMSGDYYILNVPMVSSDPYKTEPRPDGFGMAGDAGLIKVNGQTINANITLGQRGTIYHQDIVLTLQLCYLDADGDGYGDPNNNIQMSPCPVGYVMNSMDCTDTDPTIHQDATEICNELDDDCDGSVDEEEAAGCIRYYRDEDQDEYGVDGDSLCLCVPEGYYTTTQSGDPDDLDPNIPVSDVTFNLDLPVGWSMISLPLMPENASVSVLFPKAIVVYGYEKGVGYVRVTEKLEAGKGYWVLFSEEQSYPIEGKPIQSYTNTIYDAGWKMIGGCTYPALASSDSCSIGVIYGYIQGAGYQRISELECLEAGQGYWILLNNVMEECELMVETTEQSP